MFEALILGVVQGFTEFLPVSSSGHLVLVPEFFNMAQPSLGFDILVHMATLVAVVGYFIRDIVKIVQSLFAPRRLARSEVKYWRRLFVWLVIGSVPAGLAGVLFADFFEGFFSNTLAVGIFLLVTSLLLWGADFALGRVRREPAQFSSCAARMRSSSAASRPWPSRPVSAGRAPPCRRASSWASTVPPAARFSFLLSIPAILGAFVFKLKDISGGFAGTGGGAYAVGAVAAAISGFVAVAFLMRYVKEHRLRLFAIYTAALGLLVVILSAA